MKLNYLFLGWSNEMKWIVTIYSHTQANKDSISGFSLNLKSFKHTALDFHESLKQRNDFVCFIGHCIVYNMNRCRWINMLCHSNRRQIMYHTQYTIESTQQQYLKTNFTFLSKLHASIGWVHTYSSVHGPCEWANERVSKRASEPANWRAKVS